jgi:hypothetical protein
MLVVALTIVAVPAPVGAAGTDGGTVPAAVQQPEDDPDGDPSTDDAPIPDQDMIPEPNSGRPPSDAGDRGGALQGVVFVLIVIGVGGIGVLAVWESRRARVRRTAASGGRAQASSP